MEIVTEQIDLFEQAEVKTNDPIQYEPLDIQLAELMQELNAEKSTILKNCTLEISRHTREGQIAIPCSESQQSELLKTKVVGEAGDYKPLIIDKGYLYLNRYWNYQHQLAEQIKSRLSSADDVNQLSAEQTSWIKTHLDKYFKADNQNQGSDETNWQQVASALALIHKFLIVSGGPGTGKTTTITRILALLIEQRIEQRTEHMLRPKSGHGSATVSDKKLRILLAAPTGKAAIRMLDAIGEAQQKLRESGFVSEDVLEQMPINASTIHKLLGYQPDSVQFKHNRSNPLNADVVLVDEASMIDIALMSKLVEAVPAHAKLILIGDKDQLSSVETGSVFADICGDNADKNLHSEAIIYYLSKVIGDEEDVKTEVANSSSHLHDHIVTLQKNWRFSEDSGISQLAIATNSADAQQALEILKSGNVIDSDKDKEKNKNTPCKFILPEALNETDLISPWKQYFEVLNDPKSSIKEIFEAFNQYRVLCALRKGSNGSIGMSNRIETLIAKQGLINSRAFSNQSQKHVSGQKQNWYHGRPVMITQNSYSKGLYNGDTGITLMDGNGQTKVWFPSDDGSVSAEGSFKSYAPVRLPANETTWAMTIHKSQGSEFDEVTIILPYEVMPLLTRQLIYTGVTRAKERVSVVASDGVFKAGVGTGVVRATQIERML